MPDFGIFLLHYSKHDYISEGVYSPHYVAKVSASLLVAENNH